MITVQDSFASADADAVQERLGAQYGTIRVTGARIAMDEQILATPHFCLNRHALSGSLSIEAELLMFTSVLATGAYRWSVDGEEGDARTDPFLLRPNISTAASMADTEVIALTVDPAHLERTARLYYSDERLTVGFVSAAPVDSTHGRTYRNLLTVVPTYLSLLPGSELLQRSLYRLVATSLLECFRLSGDPAARRDSARSLLEGYRRARAFIDDHASEAITVEDIAGAAALSTPQLDAAMRAHSPSGADAAGELRRVRLAGAHADLVLADRTRGDTVRDIALRWGFPPSSFARSYRATYRATPQHTLLR
nr:AraC family transcriptional regulator [Microbacterium lemovicicum]